MTGVLSLKFRETEELSKALSFGGVTISITKDGEVTIHGAKSLKIDSEDFDLQARKVSIRATESYDLDVDGKLYIGSSEPVTIQSTKIDLNPNIKVDSEGKEYSESGYRGKK